jgi:hypothetical protein
MYHIFMKFIFETLALKVSLDDRSTMIAEKFIFKPDTRAVQKNRAVKIPGKHAR